MSSSDTHQTDSYNPAEVERKWQARWDEQGVNTWTEDALRSAEKPFYNLMMFPYPSAEGLHVGTSTRSRAPTSTAASSVARFRVFELSVPQVKKPLTHNIHPNSAPMTSKTSGKWKDALLKTSLPLEFLVAERLGHLGYFVDGEFTYIRRNDEGKDIEFSVDVDAVKLVGEEATWAEIHVLAECKYNYPGVKWVFSPYADHEAVTRGLIGNYHHLCVRRTAKWGPYDVEENLPYCTKGVELHDDNANPQAVTRALSQVQYSIPWLLYRLHRLQASIHNDEDSNPSFLLPIVVSTAELYVLKPSLSLRHFQSAGSITDVAEKVNALIVHREPGVQWSNYVEGIFDQLLRFYPEVKQRIEQIRPLLADHGYESYEMNGLEDLRELYEHCANHVLVVQFEALDDVMTRFNTSIEATYSELHQVGHIKFDRTTGTSRVEHTEPMKRAKRIPKRSRKSS